MGTSYGWGIRQLASDFKIIVSFIHSFFFHLYVHLGCNVQQQVPYTLLDSPRPGAGLRAWPWGPARAGGRDNLPQTPNDLVSFILSFLIFSSIFTYTQIVMCKFHTLFLTHQGRVLACGHGHGGRLGLGDETTCLRPQLLKSLGNTCKMIAGARDHSLFLSERYFSISGMRFLRGSADFDIPGGKNIYIYRFFFSSPKIWL